MTKITLHSVGETLCPLLSRHFHHPVSSLGLPTRTALQGTVNGEPRTERRGETGLLLVNQNTTVKVALSTGMYWHSRHTSWTLLLSKKPAADITIIAQ
jgi:hypothetical protein